MSAGEEKGLLGWLGWLKYFFMFKKKKMTIKNALLLKEHSVERLIRILESKTGSRMELEFLYAF